MTISIGDHLPEATLFELIDQEPTQISSVDVFKGKTVALFGVPGAFTRTCHNSHMPGFVATASAFQAKGMDQIICLTVNDPFVTAEWGRVTGAEAAGIRVLSDPFAEMTKAMGLDYDVSVRGLGVRCQRFSALVKDGEVAVLNLEETPGQLTCSTGDNLLDQVDLV